MAVGKTATIGFDVIVSLGKRDDYWAAHVDPIGMTVYGDTRDAVERRAKEGIDFFLKHTPDVLKYLEFHDISHHISYASDDADEISSRITYPVSTRVESPVYA